MTSQSTLMDNQNKIRVLVADDHPIVRQGVIANVKPQPDMLVVAEAGDGLEALQLIKEHTPDVVLLDLRMPGMDGLDVIAEVNNAKLRSRVIIMTAAEGE